MRVGVVIPTLGARDSLQRLLDTLSHQSLRPSAVVVVNQGPAIPEALISNFGLTGIPLEVLTQPPGVANARNAGCARLMGRCDILATPDDDVWFSPDAFALAHAEFVRDAKLGALSGVLLWPDDRSRLPFPKYRLEVDRKTVWRTTLEATMFFRASAFSETGGYDSRLGLGALSPWQSGEGTELLLRMMQRGWKVSFDPAVRIFEEDPRPPDRSARIRRLFSYAAGTGRVYRMHYSRTERVRFVAKSAARLLLSAGRGNLAEGMAVFKGRMLGLRRSGPDE